MFGPQENARLTFSNSSCLKTVFEKLRFRDGLTWMEGLSCVLKFLQRTVNRALGNFRLLVLLGLCSRHNTMFGPILNVTENTTSSVVVSDKHI